MQSVRAFWHNLRHGYLSVLIFYVALSSLAYGVYFYVVQLPQAQGVITAPELLMSKGNWWEGLARVWFIFAWGFGIQLLVQVGRVVRRRPREAGMGRLLKHGAWMSANAGLFEEIIFRLYAFLSSIILLRYLDELVHGWLQGLSEHVVLPLANIVTLGLFRAEFAGNDWALGTAIILGSLFFRSAHVHYGKLSKANVWLIGMVMFWLMFNYGLITAILAHFLYDAVVYAAIVLSSPLQPRNEREE